MKKIIFLAASITFLALTTSAQKAQVFITDGKAIRGYDPIAFFTEGKPLKGADSLVYRWNDANWYFVSQANMEKFKANPTAYAPQYGGYCAYGASDGEGHKAPTETDTWTIVNGKLYFNYNKKVKELWTKNQSELIKKADANWTVIKDKG